jgi:hypothetical protein
MLRSPIGSVLAAIALAATLIAPQSFAQTSGSASSSSSSASPPPSSAASSSAPSAAPELGGMAPIPNPEDMPSAERHSIYGHAYDYLDREQGAATEPETHHYLHHRRHHHERRHHHRTQHERAVATHRVHARYGEGFTGGVTVAKPGAVAVAKPKPVKAVKTAKAATTKPAAAASPSAAASSAAPAAPVTATAPASAPASSQSTGRILAAAMALLLGAFVVFMALRQTLTARRRPPLRNYQAPPAEAGTDDKKAS